MDSEFEKIYQVIRMNTLVDKYRCYELWSIVDNVSHLSGSIIEIGVWRGGTGALIAACARKNNIKERIYLCDTFSGVVKAGPNDSGYVGGEHADASLNIVSELLNKLDLGNVEILQGIFPEDTAGPIADQKFRFCHIDVDVYESAREIFQWVWPRIIKGGYVVFDDYGFDTCNGITKFVNEEIKKNNYFFVHNLNGHAIVFKNT